MKAKRKLIALTLLFGLAFPGCGTVEWDNGSLPASEREAVTAPETLPAREETAMEPVARGEYTLLRCEAPVPGGDAALTDAFQAGDAALILVWSGGGGSALEALDPMTGESLYQTVLGGEAYGVEPDLLTPGEYRIDSTGKAAYHSAVTGEATDERELPLSLRDAVRWDYPAHLGAPFDLIRDNLTVYASGEGIALAGRQDEAPVTLLDNASIPDWLAYWGLDAEAYDPSLLFYIAPRIMGGGKYVAATAYYAGEDGARCIGIASAETGTSKISYFPDPVASGEGPAERVNDDVLHARGEAGDVLITLSTGETELIPYDGDGGERRSFDYQSFARLETTEYDDGFREVVLRWEQAGQPEGAELLTLGGYARAEIVAVTEGYILLEAEEPGGKAGVLAVSIP